MRRGKASRNQGWGCQFYRCWARTSAGGKHRPLRHRQETLPSQTPRPLFCWGSSKLANDNCLPTGHNVGATICHVAHIQMGWLWLAKGEMKMCISKTSKKQETQQKLSRGDIWGGVPESQSVMKDQRGVRTELICPRLSSFYIEAYHINKYSLLFFENCLWAIQSFKHWTKGIIQIPCIQGIPLIRSGNELEEKFDFNVTSAHDRCLPT